MEIDEIQLYHNHLHFAAPTVRYCLQIIFFSFFVLFLDFFLFQSEYGLTEEQVAGESIYFTITFWTDWTVSIIAKANLGTSMI